MPDVEQATANLPEPKVGSYRLIRPLGSGGMSTVFLAAHADAGHEVVLKILPRTLAKNPTLLQRFLREAKSAEALEHPNIVSIFDRGEDDGRHYLVLEYVAGGDLSDRVRSGGPLGAAEAVKVIRAAAQGLSHAAGRGLIHRDVKPANILLTADGHVKVTDLGLALDVADEDERVTRDGTTVGTVDYMAPEQARDSRATSVRSDIYSLGCTFYYLLTGSPPFPGGDIIDRLRRHALEPAPDVRKVRPELPPALAKLIQRMMAKRPEQRFADYDQLIEALDALPISEVGDDEPQLVPLDDEDQDFGWRIKPNRPAGPSANAMTVETPHPDPGLLPDLLDDPKEAKPPPKSPGSSAANRTGPATPTDTQPGKKPRRKPSTPDVAPPLLSQILDEEPESTLPPPVFGPRRSYKPEASTSQYVLRGLMIGLAIVVIGFGIPLVVRLVWQATHETPKTPSNQGAPASPKGQTKAIDEV